MRHTKEFVRVTVTVAGLVALSACSGGSSGSTRASGSTGAGGYGDCEVYGEKGSIELDPVTPGVLTVQTNLPSPGWWKGDTPDSITGGYEYCLAANLAHRAGLDTVKVVNVSFDALVAGQTKEYDIAMAQISVTPEREKVVTFSAPYFDSNIGVLAQADSGLTEDNISGATLGVQVGTTAVDWTEGTLAPDESAKIFQDTTSMVAAVSSGMVDASVQDTAIVLGFAKNSGGSLEVVGQFETGEQYAAIYPKGSANQEPMDEAITAMEADQTLDKLSETWLGPELGGDPNSVPVWDVR